MGVVGAEQAKQRAGQVLTELGKPHEFHSYEGAGHAFFSVNRPAYRPEAATDGWQKIWDFYGRYLAG